MLHGFRVDVLHGFRVDGTKSHIELSTPWIQGR